MNVDEPVLRELARFLEQYYPGSVLDDGYDFVQLKHYRWITSTRQTGVSAVRVYQDLFKTEQRLLVTCVSVDLRKFVASSVVVEEREIWHTPDWNVQRPQTQFFAGVSGSQLDAEGFFGATNSFCAGYVFSPRTGLALTYSGCYAATEETRSDLVRRYGESWCAEER
jgi:hypothetical protein